MKLTMLICCLTLAAGFTATNTFANPKAEKAAVEKAEFDGHCAMGVCEGRFVKADPRIKLEKNDKTYCFADETSKKNFERNYEANLKKAHAQWKKFIVRGGVHAQ